MTKKEKLDALFNQMHSQETEDTVMYDLDSDTYEVVSEVVEENDYDEEVTEETNTDEVEVTEEPVNSEEENVLDIIEADTEEKLDVEKIADELLASEEELTVESIIDKLGFSFPLEAEESNEDSDESSDENSDEDSTEVVKINESETEIVDKKWTKDRVMNLILDVIIVVLMIIVSYLAYRTFV